MEATYTDRERLVNQLHVLKYLAVPSEHAPEGESIDERLFRLAVLAGKNFMQLWVTRAAGFDFE